MIFLYIFFFLILNKLCTSALYLATFDQCLSFENSQRPTNSSCWLLLFISDNQDAAFRKNCLECKIKGNVLIKTSCASFISCATFTFDDNSLFEHFFLKQSAMINYLFSASTNPPLLNTLTIIIENYNRTEISFKYIDSILDSKSPSYNTLRMKFIKPIFNVKLIEIKNDFPNISISAIYLEFSCNHHIDDNEWIKYTITSNGLLIKDPQICGHSGSSTISIRNTSNTTIPIQSSSFTELLQKAKSILFYLLIFLAIFIICVIVTCYMFSRQSSHKKHELIDQDSKIRPSVASFDTADTTAKSIDSLPLKFNENNLTAEPNNHILYNVSDNY